MNDFNGVNRLFIGPISNFQNCASRATLSGGQHQLIPNFQLPAGQTWAQVVPTIQSMTAFTPIISQDASPGTAPKKSVPRVPRPPNPFIIYRAAHHKSVADAHPKATNNEICKSIVDSASVYLHRRPMLIMPQPKKLVVSGRMRPPRSEICIAARQPRSRLLSWQLIPTTNTSHASLARSNAEPRRT